jgi:hypothetical protein
MPNFTGTLQVGGRPLKFCRVDLQKLRNGTGTTPSHPQGAAGEATRVPTGSTFDPAGSAHTDATGNFSIAPSGTIAATDSVRLAIYLEDEGNRIVSVTYNATGSVWSIPYPATGALPGSNTALGAIEIPRITAAGGNTIDAAKIYETIVRAKLWYDDLGAGFPSMTAISVYYPDPGDGSRAARDAAFYDPDQRKIHLSARQGAYASTILHEYGHHVFFLARTDGWRPEGLQHVMDGQSPDIHDMNLDDFPHWEDQESEDERRTWLHAVRYQLETDFSEAYATFFGQAVLASARFRDAGGAFDMESQVASACATAAYMNRRLAAGNGYGDGPTAAYLWDLIDSGTDRGRDTVHRTFAEVHASYRSHQPKRLADFHGHLRTAFGEAQVDAIAALNHVDRVVRYTSGWLAHPTDFAAAAAAPART